MPADTMSQHAIVLAGNGANAAYEVGVMKALLREACAHNNKRPLDPEILGLPFGH